MVYDTRRGRGKCAVYLREVIGFHERNKKKFSNLGSFPPRWSLFQEEEEEGVCNTPQGKGGGGEFSGPSSSSKVDLYGSPFMALPSAPPFRTVVTSAAALKKPGRSSKTEGRREEEEEKGGWTLTKATDKAEKERENALSIEFWELLCKWRKKRGAYTQFTPKACCLLEEESVCCESSSRRLEEITQS